MRIDRFEAAGDGGADVVAEAQRAWKSTRARHLGLEWLRPRVYGPPQARRPEPNGGGEDLVGAPERDRR